jgi:hypothetical protein
MVSVPRGLSSASSSFACDGQSKILESFRCRRKLCGLPLLEAAVKRAGYLETMGAGSNGGGPLREHNPFDTTSGFTSLPSLLLSIDLKCFRAIRTAITPVDDALLLLTY